MRKDVRLGLGVGGILFGVVLIYTLFFAGDRKTGSGTGDSQQQASAAGEIDGGSVSAAAQAPLVTQTPTLPAQPRGGGDAGTASGAAGGTPSREQAPARNEPAAPQPQRTENVAVTAPNPLSLNTPSTLTPADWRTALETGLLPSSSQRNASNAGRDNASEAERAAPVGRAGPSASNTYIVRSGDTFWSIAQAAYGDGNFVSHIMRANPRITAKSLRAGMILALPPRDQVVSGSPANATRPPGGEIDPVKHYRVRNGDSLSTISQKLYGGSAQVDRIYQLNKELIGPNPSALKLNMVLQLPEPPTRLVTMAQ